MTILLLLALWMAANAGAAPCPLLGGATPAAACKCGYPTVWDAYAQSQAVFSGVVVEVQDTVRLLGRDSLGNVVFGTGSEGVTLRVTHEWKGARGGDTITLLDAPVCGVGFRTGGEYLVYALAHESGVLFTSPCQRTRMVTPPGGSQDFRLPATWEEVAVLDSVARALRP